MWLLTEEEEKGDDESARKEWRILHKSWNFWTWRQRVCATSKSNFYSEFTLHIPQSSIACVRIWLQQAMTPRSWWRQRVCATSLEQGIIQYLLCTSRHPPLPLLPDAATMSIHVGCVTAWLWVDIVTIPVLPYDNVISVTNYSTQFPSCASDGSYICPVLSLSSKLQGQGF